MKPDAIYKFSRFSGNRTHLILTGHKGRTIPGFPSVYSRGKYKGEKYIIFRKKMYFNNQNCQRFSHTLELTKNRMVARLVFCPNIHGSHTGRTKTMVYLLSFPKISMNLQFGFFRI